MHPANKLFWSNCKVRYPRYFEENNRVLEFGSYDINGSIRPLFQSRDYVGIDWRPGPNVDHVSLAHNVRLSDADVVVSASMLEHDPYWAMSLETMVLHLRTEGLMILSWGAARNREHCLAEAPDGLFHALPAGRVLRQLQKLGMVVHEFWYESSLATMGFARNSDGTGEVGLVAFVQCSQANTMHPFRHFDALLPEDAVPGNP